MQGLKSGSNAVAAVSFLTPGLGLLALFVVVPILLTAWISLHRGSMAVPYSQLEWVGLQNYAILFQQATFRTALVNVFLYSLTNLIIILPLALLLGIFLYQSTIRGKNTLRTVLFVPYMIPTVAVAIVWGYLYEPQYGPLNQILGWLHIPPQNWLGSVNEAMLSLVILNVWQTLGYYVVMVVAGLTEIPQECYEAACANDVGERKERMIHVYIKRSSNLRIRWRLPSQLLQYLIMIALICVMLFPFFWLVASSLKAPNELGAVPPIWWSAHPDISSYITVFQVVPFARALLNSTIVTVSSTVGILVTSIMAGYVFAKHNFRGKNFIFICVLATMMVPQFIMLIPLYRMMNSLNLTNSYPGLILPNLAN